MQNQTNVDGASIQSIVRRLRLHAGTLHGPNHDASRDAAKALESLASVASYVVRSADNWKNVHPVHPQIQQDIELLRDALGENKS
jgi:hypothetical protein